MSPWLKRYLRRHDLRFHFIVAIVLGFVLRSLTAFFVYGPQALDDYKHGVWPSYQMFKGLPIDLPDYRSHLLNWMLLLFLRVGSLFGVESALAQVRTMYFGLGLVSLLSLVGAFIYVRLRGSRQFGGLALYLLALYPLMPFLSTRAFGESVALPFVVLGLAICERSRQRSDSFFGMSFGFLLLGVAVLLRFQVGVISCVYLTFLLYERKWRLALATCVSGLILIGAQAGIDIASGKSAFGTLTAYLEENAGGAAKYGISPWYNTWLLVLALTLFPFSIVFFKRLKYVWSAHKPVVLSLLAFVTIHSIVPHKEERFMYPIVGVLLILLAYAWALNRHDRRTRTIYQPVFLFLCAIALPLACLVNSQAGEIEPAAIAEDRLGQVGYLDYQSLFGQSLIRDYFLRPPSEIVEVSMEDLTLSHAESLLDAHPDWKGAVFLTSAEEAFDRIRQLNDQRSPRLQCGDAQIASSAVDRILYRLNPKHNQRRRPTLYILCERSHA